jgi:ABC-type polysaccharide/polyol phosphate transport system ATPase subunit
MPHIRFTNVALEYPIRENVRTTLKEFIVKGLFRRSRQTIKSVQAIRNLSFEITDGERVGIIGFNGAGKSSLLRTIAGVYPIQQGERTIHGTINALFDITIGFEPESSGWDNIYFRSYLQGETPNQIKEKLQDIQDFTELGSFLDLPIRCYSTGMMMRLAFAIATSRATDILLIDEVFATGDLIFQKKAETRMKELLHRAPIVVMVGHQLEFLKEFCTKVMWLDQGQLRHVGPAPEVIQAYRAEATARKLRQPSA